MRLLPLVVVLLLVVSAVVVEAQPSKSRETRSPATGRPGDGNATAEPSGKNASRAPGRLTMEGADAHGRYVNFTIDLATCSVTDFTVYGLRFFDAIRLPGTDCEQVRGG